MTTRRILGNLIDPMTDLPQTVLSSPGCLPGGFAHLPIGFFPLTPSAGDVRHS